MNFWQSKSYLILMFLIALLCMNAIKADSVQQEIPAEVLNSLQSDVKPPVIELLATSEFNTPKEMSDRLKRTSGVLKNFVQKYGALLGIGQEGTVAPAVPMLAQVPEVPAIIAASPVLPMPGAIAEDADDSVQPEEEIKPEPPAAALSGASPVPSSGVPDAIQPPAALAAPIVSTIPTISGLPAIPIIPGPIGIVPDAGLQDDDQSSDEPEAPSSLPAGMPGINPLIPELPSLGDVVTPPAMVPALPAPAVTPVPNILPPSPMPVAPMAITPLAPLPVAYQELENLDREMNSLIAMNLSTIALPSDSINLPAQPLDIVSANQQHESSSELMSVNFQDIPEVAANASLNALSLQDLTLAELE